MKTTILTLLIFMASCHKDDNINNQTNNNINVQTDQNGLITAIPYLWKKPLHNQSSVSNGYISNAIHYDGNIAIPTSDGKQGNCLTMINPNNGETIWQWNDNYSPGSEQIIIFEHYQNNNLLTYQNGSKSYCINLNNGSTKWKKQRNSSFFVQISGIGNDYFSFGQSETQFSEYDERIAFKGNLRTGKIEEYYTPNFTLKHIIGNRIGDVTRIESCTLNNVQHLVMTWQELTDDNIWLFQTYLGLYNYEINKWIYDKKIMNEPDINGVVLAPPIIYKNKIYANIGHELVCYDIQTGNRVWSKSFLQDFMFSGFIIKEDKIIANNEDTYTYCLNTENGKTIWKTKSSGTCGKISYLNGIVYFVGGSSGKLHAIDVKNGNHIWKINASNLSEAKDEFVTNAVYVIPTENGNPAKIIALSHLNAYCFNAYK